MGTDTEKGTGMLTYRNGSKASRGGADLVISLTPGQVAALGDEDMAGLAEAFDTILAALASARGDRSKCTERPSLKDGRDDLDWHEWAIRDVSWLRDKLAGLLAAEIRAHASAGGTYGGLATAMEIPRATAQHRRDVVMRGDGVTPGEEWATSPPSQPGSIQAGGAESYYCPYCGHDYGPGDSRPEIGDHMRVCPRPDLRGSRESVHIHGNIIM